MDTVQRRQSPDEKAAQSKSVHVVLDKDTHDWLIAYMEKYQVKSLTKACTGLIQERLAQLDAIHRHGDWSHGMIQALEDIQPRLDILLSD